MTPKKTALITGASSGIGDAFADVLAANGFDLIVTARREHRLQAVAARLAQAYGCRVDVIPCDLAADHGIAALCAEIHKRGLTVDILVQSAGFGSAGGFAASPWHVHDAMLRVMVRAPSELVHRLLPGMIDRRWGRIINVASTAGLVQQGAGTTYSAAKAFVISFSESLAREVARFGIHVTAVCPGATRSEFHEAAGTTHTVRGLPQWMWMDAATVARQGFDASMAGKSVYVNGLANRMVVRLLRIVPLSVIAAGVRRMTRLRRTSSPHVGMPPSR